MTSYTFMLNFLLPSGNDNPEHFLDALFEAGCDDATVGVGLHGMVGLDFTRDATSADDALRSAVRDVQRAIPEAVLVQVGPDLVGLTDMAEIFGFTRQNMRKYATGVGSAREAFPIPTILGEPSLWHFAEIARWLQANTSVELNPEMVEVSKIAARMNWEIEGRRVEKIMEKV